MGNFKLRNSLIYSLLILFVAAISSFITYIILLNKIKSGTSFSLKNTGISAFPSGRTDIRLFYPDPDGNGFGFETRKIMNEGSDLEKIERVIKELIKGPRTRLISVIPKGTQLINLFLDKDNILYLNFNKLLQDNHPCGVDAEYQTIYSLFKTILTNFNDIKTIKIMMEGRIAKTLCGHIDLSAPVESLLDFELQEECSKKSELHPYENFEENSDHKELTSYDETVEIPLFKPKEEERAVEEIDID